MKIKINEQLKDINGQDIKIPSGVMTVKSVAIESLLFPKEKDTVKEKMEKYELYKKLRDCKKDEIELTVEEIAKLKAIIGETKPPVVMGQVWDILEK